MHIVSVDLCVATQCQRRQTDIQLGKRWGAKDALQWGCQRHPHDPRASLGFPTPALGHALRKAYLNFQSPFLAAVNVPTMVSYTVPDPTGRETQGCSPALAGGSGVSFAELEEFALA